MRQCSPLLLENALDVHICHHQSHPLVPAHTHIQGHKRWSRATSENKSRTLISRGLFSICPCTVYTPAFILMNKESLALARVAQLLGALSHNQKVAGLIPRLGTYGRQLIDASLWHQCFSLPLSLSLKSNEKVSSSENKKKKN